MTEKSLIDLIKSYGQAKYDQGGALHSGASEAVVLSYADAAQDLLDEYGIWSDEGGGFVEAGIWSLGVAETALIDYRRDDPAARIRKICPDHEEQPADDCEDCLAETCEDCGAPKAENPSTLFGDDKCASCRDKADEEDGS